MQIRIATRHSDLALWQAEHVAAILREHQDVNDVQLVPLSTRGDEILDRSLQKIGGKGLFIKELEVAMQEDRADLAVHSMKDVPVEMPGGFCIAAVLPRAASADALVGSSMERLPEGARVGSSSLRRAAQLRLLRPDVSIEPLRGNVNTRLRKLDDGEYDAIVLAVAGLQRLDMEERINHVFSPDEMLPAAAQGVIGIECLTENVALRALLAQLNDSSTARTTMAERTIARRLQASCRSPVAVYAATVGSVIMITALVAMPDGSQVVRDSIGGPADDAEQLARTLANKLIAAGARDILAAIDNANGD
jgi:hydroxymethylbilane synthase